LSEGGRSFCENCGTEIRQTTNFCPNCGVAQDAKERRASTRREAGRPPPPAGARTALWSAVKLIFGVFIVLPLVLVVTLWILFAVWSALGGSI
jgi:hypothetical protein